MARKIYRFFSRNASFCSSYLVYFRRNYKFKNNNKFDFNDASDINSIILEIIHSGFFYVVYNDYIYTITN